MIRGPGAALTGVIVAGGRSRRMGAPKAVTVLAGRPLIGYAVEALAPVCERVAVVVKPDTELPPLDAERWDEPAEPRHPIAGIVHALERARTPILVCAADMPFVTPDVLRRIADALQPAVTIAVASCQGDIEPLLAAYAPAVREPLTQAPPDAPLRRTVELLRPVRVEIDRDVAFNVNTPADLAEAERRIRSR